MKMPFVDVHCHILPRVDDGAGSLEEALDMLRMEQEQGAREIILTPHYRRGYFEPSRERIRKQFEALEQAAGEAGISLRLHLGCEFYRQNEMERFLKEDDSYRIAGTRYVLLEFLPGDLADTIWRCAGDLLIGGYRPVIAHAERYRALRDAKLVNRLVEAGAYIQVNAGSILGRNGWTAKRFCRKLLKEGRVHVIGSDAHRASGRTPCMGECAEYLKKKIGEEQTEKILWENPQKILAGKYL